MRQAAAAAAITAEAYGADRPRMRRAALSGSFVQKCVANGKLPLLARLDRGSGQGSREPSRRASPAAAARKNERFHFDVQIKRPAEHGEQEVISVGPENGVVYQTANYRSSANIISVSRTLISRDAQTALQGYSEQTRVSLPSHVKMSNTVAFKKVTSGQ